MKVTATVLPDVLLIEPAVFEDDRGFFMETWHARKFSEGGIKAEFVQDNHSRSSRGTLRGLHYQIIHPQGKLVRVSSGEVYDVAVDMRRSSSTFGRWVGVHLSAENKRQLWVPEGFAHGFLVISEQADFLYKCTDCYVPQHERVVAWNDPDLAIDWLLADSGQPILSSKDASGVRFADAEYFP